MRVGARSLDVNGQEHVGAVDGAVAVVEGGVEQEHGVVLVGAGVSGGVVERGETAVGYEVGAKFHRWAIAIGDKIQLANTLQIIE